MNSVIDSSRCRGRFLESMDRGDQARTIVIGAPMDHTVSGRPGSRYGPEAIRFASELIEDYSPILDRELADARFYDVGDVLTPFGDIEASLNNIEAACKSVLETDKRLLVLGGEHLVTVAAVRAAHRLYPDLTVLQFDAHADLRDDYLGQKFSHATAMRRVCDIIGMDSLWQLGIRSGTREEYALMRSLGRMVDSELLCGADRSETAQKIIDAIGSRPTYLTIDIDVLDPAVAPGTGTPEPGGLGFGDLLHMLLRLLQLNVVGVDIVEVNPVVDSSGRTSIVAAKLVREILLAL